MDREKITKPELELRVLDLLRKAPKCTEAQAVFLDFDGADPKDGNWAITHFHPGGSTRDDCEEELWNIQMALRQQFQLIEP